MDTVLSDEREREIESAILEVYSDHVEKELFRQYDEALTTTFESGNVHETREAARIRQAMEIVSEIGE